MEGRTVAKVGHNRREKVQLSERVTIARHEQHRNLDPRKMLGPLDARLAGGMQRETQEGEAANSLQR